jgi:hypothetical protein
MQNNALANLAPILLPRLEAHRLPGIDAGPGAIYPYYDGLSLANIPASVCHWLGIPSIGAPALDAAVLDLYPRRFQNVILFVIDGLGWNMLQPVLERTHSDPEARVWAELGCQAAIAPLTSITPSTTASALTTFWTGRTPAEHGVLGYEVWLKEYGLSANMILHAPAAFLGDVGSLQKAGFSPDTFLPIGTLGAHLCANGITPHAFQHQAIARSGLSTMLLPGAQVHPFRSLSDLFVSLEELLAQNALEPRYIYAYWGDLDEHSHRYGPEDARVGRELANFHRQLQAFWRGYKARARQDTLLLITADHGHMATPRRSENELRNHPELLNCLVMPASGEARLPYVYVRPGREARFLRYVEAHWPGLFTPLPAAQAVEAGLFGPTPNLYPRVLDRVGDLIMVPNQDAYWWFGSRDNPLLGRHGGLSRTEMLIPLFSAVL